MPNESFVDREICERGSADRVQPLRGDVTPGADVQVRGRLWIVDAVAAHEDCTSLRLVDKRTGHPRVLLWPFDRPVAVTRSRRLRVVPLRRWWAEVASLCTDVRVGGLQVAPTAARIVPYQLAPVLAVAQGIARVFLADEVGLGKTIQAGWIVAERCARQSDARVLIAVPAGLRQQWQTELVTHFGIDAIVADAAWLRLAFSDLPADVNPWSLPGVYVTSIDFLKRPDVLRPIASLVWDALVVDEAHTAAAPTGRFAALSRISRRSRALVLITATPFSGDIAAFESLASLGTRTADDPPTMFRRSREDAGLSHTRRHRFASIRVSAAERHLHRLLERYTSEVWTSSPDEGARLAMTILRKRALSSPRTVARSLDRRIALLNARPSAPQQLSLFDDELVADDEEPSLALAAPGLADQRRELRWLARLAAAAHAAPDSKHAYLVRLLRRLRGESAIVFTEYRDTLRRLADDLPESLLLHGGMTSTERAETQARFNERGGLLLATDAASEGLNLHHRCRVVVCYELPWNPVRLEQRIGRVDRIGQTRRVHAMTFVARDTAEDLVIAALARRLMRVAATLGERDRLAGYLTEARTAGIVMGAAPGALPDAEPLPAIRIEPVVSAGAQDEAARLSARARLSPLVSRDGDVVVSTLRASASMGRGAVLVFAWTASAGHGRAIDRQVWIVHVDADIPGQPRRARDVRGIAGGIIAAAERRARDLLAPLAAARLEQVRAHHAATVERAIARERVLRDWWSPVEQVQPGLFDRRAIASAEARIADQERARRDHDERIAALLRERDVETRIELAAVLIVHRGAP